MRKRNSIVFKMFPSFAQKKIMTEMIYQYYSLQDYLITIMVHEYNEKKKIPKRRMLLENALSISSGSYLKKDFIRDVSDKIYDSFLRRIPEGKKKMYVWRKRISRTDLISFPIENKKFFTKGNDSVTVPVLGIVKYIYDKEIQSLAVDDDWINSKINKVHDINRNIKKVFIGMIKFDYVIVIQLVQEPEFEIEIDEDLENFIRE